MRIKFPWGVATPPAAPPTPAASATPQDEPLRREMGTTETQFSVPVTYMSSDVPSVDSAYGYGHLDGRRGVDPENFRQFIGHTVAGEGIERMLTELASREKALREEAREIRMQRADIAARSEELRMLVVGEDTSAKAVQQTTVALEAAEQMLEEKRAAGSWAQAILFIAAGTLFILGDVVMSRSVVADGLDLTGHTFLGIDESWIFALGLAMISVVLKPAYDRLVEKPYHAGYTKWFGRTIISLAILSVGTLYVLGAFRSEAHGNQIRIDIIQNAEISNAEKATKLENLQIGSLDSALGRWSFILSGILFAAAGAVSLSIGLRYARDIKYERRPAQAAAKIRRADAAAARIRHERLTADASRQRAELERLTVMAADRPDPSDLENRAERVAAELTALLASHVETRTLRLRSLYADGYELGQILAHDAEEERRRMASTEERPRRKRPRPFVALRRMIRESTLLPNQQN